MRLVNPFFVSPVAAWVAANKAAVGAWLAAAPRSAMAEITFDYIRANAAGMAGKSNGDLAEMCRALGLTVILD